MSGKLFPILGLEKGCHLSLVRPGTQVELQSIRRPNPHGDAPVAAVDQVHAALAIGRRRNREFQRPGRGSVHGMGLGQLHLPLGAPFMVQRPADQLAFGVPAAVHRPGPGHAPFLLGNAWRKLFEFRPEAAVFFLDQPHPRRRNSFLETAVLDQLGIDATVEGVADLLHEDAVQGGRNGGLLFFQIDVDGGCRRIATGGIGRNHGPRHDDQAHKITQVRKFHNVPLSRQGIAHSYVHGLLSPAIDGPDGAMNFMKHSAGSQPRFSPE